MTSLAPPLGAAGAPPAGGITSAFLIPFGQIDGFRRPGFFGPYAGAGSVLGGGQLAAFMMPFFLGNNGEILGHNGVGGNIAIQLPTPSVVPQGTTGIAVACELEIFSTDTSAFWRGHTPAVHQVPWGTVYDFIQSDWHTDFSAGITLGSDSGFVSWTNTSGSSLVFLAQMLTNADYY